MHTPDWLSEASTLQGDLIAWRRRFHALPERSWQEVATSAFVAEQLRAWGFADVRVGFGGTKAGVVADLAPPHGASGLCVALRADLDALPVHEATGLAFASTVPGVMHACGHDGHTACLLGAARLLAARREGLPGRVRVLFQPAEEDMARSGAAELIAAGALDGVGAVAGLHLIPYLPAGVVGLREGPLMASGRTWKLTFTGRGGHGAMPHNAVDPTMPLAHFLLAVQGVIGRERQATLPGVVSVGSIRAGDAPNIIPAEVHLSGTIRALDEASRAALPERLRELAEGLAATWHCKAEFTPDPGGTAVVDNNPALCAVMRACAEELFGEQAVITPELQMISEDFSLYQERVPGVFAFLGAAARGRDKGAALHAPDFDFEEAVLERGAALLAAFAWRALTGARP